MSDTELLPKPKPQPVHRVEVFTGTGRRRAWSAEQKALVISESYESGDTVSAGGSFHPQGKFHPLPVKSQVSKRKFEQRKLKRSLSVRQQIKALSRTRVA